MTPLATYRLQFREGMTFERAAALAPYWRRLGVSHLYASPIFAAAAGSTHGYDVADFNRLDPGLGGEPGFRTLSDALQREGLGLVLDFVPNHMSATPDNPWWRALLEWGQESRYAEHFDIDWTADKLLLPLLGAPYAEVLEAGELSFGVKLEQACFLLCYYEHALPLNPASAAVLLARSGIPSLQSLASPLASATPETVDPLLEQFAGELAKGTAEALQAALSELSRDQALVHEVHEAQAWRLVHWRAARDSLTYRRFFEITGLIGVRVERPAVFDDVHQLLLRLVEEGRVDGVRLDHVDGLADPKGYLERLAAVLPPETWLVVEKILEPGEILPTSWPVAGTTGYEFIAALAAGLIDEAGLAELGTSYEAFIGGPVGLQAEVAAAKLQILTDNLASELTNLTRQAAELAQRQLATRDFGEDSLRRAVAAMLTSFPVYRSYVDADGPSEADRYLVAQVLERAEEQPEVEEPRTLEFIASLLLLEVPEEDREEALRFVTRFQQTTGPIMAKALEDTLFYRYHRLIGLNEVGGDLAPEAASADAVHQAMALRWETQRRALSATSTHDTKRGEDARARLYSLSEAPRRWTEAVERWAMGNARLRSALEEGTAPEPEVEWMIYQALLGVWPAELAADDAEGLAALKDRVSTFLEKALREAKLRTRWTAPDKAYEAAVKSFAAGLLDPENQGFLQDFYATGQPFFRAGAINSLSQSLLKLTAPGVPDLYQGSEGWDLSLVDPDNRRPVDFGLLESRLDEARPLPELLAEWRNGAIKQRVLQAGLAARRADPAIFGEGDYLPLAVAGPQAERVIAFARTQQDRAAVVVVPRLPLALLGPAGLAIPPEQWQGTSVALPEPLRRRRFVESLSGRELEAGETLELPTLLAEAPLACLMPANL